MTKITKVAPSSNRGAVPGERRGGREAGTPNKTTAEIRALASQHGEAAMAELVRLMKHGETETVRLAAIKELLDRAYGKPTMTLAGDPESPVHVHTTVEYHIVDPARPADQGERPPSPLKPGMH